MDARSILTMVLFLFSSICSFRPPSFHLPPIRLPILKTALSGGKVVRMGLVTTPIAIICLLLASKCITFVQVRDGIVGTGGLKPYNVLTLFISLAYMTITLDHSGLFRAAALLVSNKGGTSSWRLYIYFYLLLSFMSAFMGNDPVILSSTTFLVYYTRACGIEPLPWLFSEFVSSNTASMILFVGNPTNVIICEGDINNLVYTAYTILPFLACSVSFFITLVLQFRKHLGNIPACEPQDPRLALVDPLGAYVGTGMLATCLVAIMVASFFRVDAWMVVLPFAVAKCFFDFVNDYIRLRGRSLCNGMTSGPSELHEDSFEAVPADSPAAGCSASPGAKLPIFEKTREPPSPVFVNTASKVPDSNTKFVKYFQSLKSSACSRFSHLARRFPTFFTVFPWLPLPLVPFALSQFILIEALDHQGWIDIFAHWLVRITRHGEMVSTIWVVGVFGMLLCNFAGTNFGATILLTKVVRVAPGFPVQSTHAAAAALALASNIGAVGFTFSASLAGLLWDTMLKQKDIKVQHLEFARRNAMLVPVALASGLAVVTAEMVATS
ncbi:hypothetical protein FISHEDRAFT_51514 [Fistulina hepatica ATCC 64428]|uniref:Citrate transporter-like domain-containing protein n=1 Tax=Fistulina hepatica ATCC 64428 TaxID=1128425 RepID=A0A0D7A104_9AGAR|nr:hypothetical protein FISHEDRAFT_51514 [Fistulina hepatica ATCC 64428]